MKKGLRKGTQKHELPQLCLQARKRKASKLRLFI